MNKSNLFSLQTGFAALLVCTIAHSAFAQNASTNAPPFAPASDGPTYRPGEVLVKFRNDVTDAQIETAFRGAGLRMLKHIRTPVMERAGDIGITRALTQMPVEQAAALLSRLTGVEYAEPNWVYTHQAVSNDPYFTGGQLWGMYGDLSDPKNVYGSQAAEAWAAGNVGSSDVVIGVIDEGIQFDHPELEANIWTNTGETPGDGIDNDGNGKVDDVNGWNFITDNNSIYDAAQDDHGTHVAGTIGAVGGNGAGVAGVNWAVNIIPAKFLGPEGGSTTDAIEAVDYFTDLKLRGINIVALNNSWGGGGYSQGLHDAIIRAAKEGILFVAAAGNGHPITGRAINIDSSPVYPACYNTESAAGYDSVICVTAIDSAGRKASFANYGATTVDLGAPGVNVISTLPGGSYGAYNGTSMATPHVTGAIALCASTHPYASASEIRTALLDSTKPTSSLAGKTVTGGRLDLSSVAQPMQPPSTPVLTVIPADEYVTLTWTASAGAASYDVYRLDAPQPLGNVAGTTFVDNAVLFGATYTYWVKAKNSAGQSPESTHVECIVKATATPATPSDLNAQPVSQKKIVLTWTDNSMNETGFKVWRINGTTTSFLGSVAPNVTTFPDESLTPGEVRTYRVSAWNSLGQSAMTQDATATTFVGLPATVDAVTQGNWRGKYGSAGYRIYRFNYPGTYVSGLGNICMVSDVFPNTWNADGTTDLRALQTPDGNSRFADCYYSPSSMLVDVNLLQKERVSLYFLDWDRKQRAQRVEVTGADGKVLDAYSLSGFEEGVYLTWELEGKVQIKINWTGGDNAVLSAVFFDPAPVTEPPAAPADLTASAGDGQVTLTWSASFGASSYNVKRADTPTGLYTQVAITGGTTYTDLSVENGRTYYYVVSAVNSIGESQNSASVSATPQLATIIELIPTPQSTTVSRGSSAIFNLSVEPKTSEAVTFSVTGLPRFAKASFNPPSSNTSTTMTVTTTSKTPRGAFTLTITGTSASAIAKVAVIMTVE